MSDPLLGSRVRDNQTGYEGIATARLDFHTGCSHYVVEATKLKGDGSLVESYQFDPQRLVVTEKPAKGTPIIDEPTVKLWSVVRDEITGFPGFVSAVRASLYGPPQICIEPDRLNPTGELNMPEWFFEDRVLVLAEPKPKPVELKPELVPDRLKRRGGPSPYGSGISGVR